MIFWISGGIGAVFGTLLGFSRRWRGAIVVVLGIIAVTFLSLMALAALLPGPGAMLWPVLVVVGAVGLAGHVAGFIVGWLAGVLWRARRDRVNPPE